MSENEKEESKVMAIFIVFLIITTCLSVMALLIKLDVGGFGTSVLRPVFKDVPIIKIILPEATNEEIAKESDYPYNTLESALLRIEELDALEKNKDDEIILQNEKIQELNNEVLRLQEIETEIEDFNTEKNKFFDEIVYGETAPDADTYIEWYNTINPEYAEKIYKELITAKEADKEVLELATTYENMEPKKAADILQTMSNDLDTVTLILNNMKSESRAEILGEMEPQFAASITKKLLP